MLFSVASPCVDARVAPHQEATGLSILLLHHWLLCAMLEVSGRSREETALNKTKMFLKSYFEKELFFPIADHVGNMWK